MEQQLLRGVATTLVLLILRDGPSYGYDLVQQMSARSNHLLTFGEGTVYPLLYSLEQQEMVSGSWQQPPGGRRRRMYRLTAAGRRELTRRLADWHRFEQGMRHALRGA
jgi:PadR family transcriptional regulator PadR